MGGAVVFFYILSIRSHCMAYNLRINTCELFQQLCKHATSADDYVLHVRTSMLGCFVDQPWAHLSACQAVQSTGRTGHGRETALI